MVNRSAADAQLSRGRIAIVGPGAIGCAIASALMDCGHEVLLCAREAFEILECESPEGTSRRPAEVCCAPAEARPSPWVILAVKAHQCEGARDWLRALCGSGTTVAVAQNGVEHVERTGPHARGATVLPVVVYLPAERSRAGVVRQSGPGRLMVPSGPEGAAFEALFAGCAAIEVRQTERFASVSWQKLMINAATGALGALSLRKNEVLLEADVAELARRVMHEVAAVARARGVEIPEDAIERAFRQIRSAADHFSSITQDRLAGRPMEWDARNAVVGRLGRRVGVPTPMNDVLTTLLRAADAAGRGSAP